MVAKQWSMGLAVLVAAALSVTFVVQGYLQVPVQGSTALFLAGAALNLFATTAMGIMMATVARTMPQFGLLMMLTIVPMQVLSGGYTPRESMPEVVQRFMVIAPTTHFMELSKAILFRGAGIEVVWKQFAALVAIGTVMFLLALARFRKTQDHRADGVRDVHPPAGLTVDVRRGALRPTVVVAGRVTVDSSPQLRSMLQAAMRDATGAGVTIDMAGASYLDTSGIATLLEAATIARDRRIPLRVVGLSGEPAFLARMTGLDRIFGALGSELELP
jgi:anti-anti-sigma factor